jgi:hypothetical protein
MRMLTDWSNTKRISSNSKNALYFLRDFTNILIKVFGPGAWNSKAWDIPDLISCLIAKFFPFPGVRSLGNYWSRFQDIAHKWYDFYGREKRLAQLQEDIEDGKKTQGAIGDIPAVMAARACLAVLSTTLYLVQSILTTLWDPTN